MKNWLFFVFILSNIIYLSLNKENKKPSEKLIINEKSANNDISSDISFQNKTNYEAIEENEKPTQLTRKSNGYWIIFFILFILSLIVSGLFVFQDVLFK